MNPYEILGVSAEATEEEIKSAYKGLARTWHPDINKDPSAEEKFKNISAAYEVLKNNNWKYNPNAGNFQGFQGFNVNMADLFGSTFGFDFNPFGEAKRGIRKRKSQIYITFEEAFNGCCKKIQINNESQCGKCNGSGLILKNSGCKVCHGNGRVRSQNGNMIIATTCNACRGMGREIEKQCDECNGSGKRVSMEEINVSIIPGTIQGTVISPKNDLDLVIMFKPHAEYVLLNKGIDIGSKISIDIFDAILGNNININTLLGVKSLKIPAGVQPKTILKIKNGGYYYGGNNGDHLVEVNIEIPKITEEQREVIEKFKTELKNKQ